MKALLGKIMRVKRSVHARKKRREVLERTKGFRGEANHNYKRAKEALVKAETYAYRDRRNRKRDFRRLWITRINAAARLPVQILLNNLLYDLSEIGIPFDRVDDQDLSRPQAWDMSSILRFTLIMGALSSVFDLAMFWMLVRVFEVGPDVFRTAWFVKSTATQILVIFIIRTRGLSWASRANPLLVMSSLGALAGAFAIVLMPWGADLGFVHLPGALLAAITGVVIAYLAAAEVFKTLAIRSPPGAGPPALRQSLT